MEKEDLLTIIKYESYKRNKAILSLLWDLDARSHEITLLKIKHIRLKEKYGEQFKKWLDSESGKKNCKTIETM